ncbi:MAG: serine/threonine-protein kinase [Acidobacteriota bacterium]
MSPADSPESFARLESIFHRLSDLPEDSRRRELLELRREDPELAERVARLLDASGATWKLGDWLRGAEEPTSVEAAGVPGPADGDRPPERIGGFRILEELGQGGMGVVYLALRDDEFQQRVALKVVKRGMDTDEILDRMRRERQILAKLEHPSIARLIDGGSTEDGRPFFAMEYVEGHALLDWCRRERLGLNQRIELFLEICGAVDHAHRSLIIHRDLKPSNILVTESGTAKLLDFGIAKVLAAPAGGELRTATGQVLLTPDFASPEQVLGEPLTTATDVYSLGVLLFCMLTGDHPYREKVQSLPGLYRFAEEGTVPRASSRVLQTRSVEEGEDLGAAAGLELRPAQLARSLRGDLDDILAMALRREPERRYPSVAELAEDLRRHLDRRPVKAHPESFGYRLSRFVLRQRALVIAGCLLFFSLAAGFTGISWQARRAERARDVAEEQAEAARAIGEFLIGIFGEPDPAKHRGEEPKARDLLLRGRGSLEDAELEPETQATFALVIGRAFQQLGDHAEAADLYRRSLEARRELLASPDPGLVEAMLYLADAESLLGRLEEAERLLIEAIDQQRALGQDPAMMATLVLDLGVNSLRAGDPQAAEGQMLEALELRRRHLGDRHVDTAMALNNLAALRFQQDRREEAAELLTEAHSIQVEKRGATHPEPLRTQASLAATLYRLGRSEEALERYRQLTEGQRKVYGNAHPVLARTLSSRGSILMRAGSFAEALEFFEEAESIFEEGPGRGEKTHLRAAIGVADARAELSDAEGALEAYARVFGLLEERESADGVHLLAISALSGRARLLTSLGRAREATRDWCASLALRAQHGLLDTERGREERAALEELTGSSVSGASDLGVVCRSPDGSRRAATF